MFLENEVIIVSVPFNDKGTERRIISVKNTVMTHYRIRITSTKFIIEFWLRKQPQRGKVVICILVNYIVVFVNTGSNVRRW